MNSLLRPRSLRASAFAARSAGRQRGTASPSTTIRYATIPRTEDEILHANVDSLEQNTDNSNILGKFPHGKTISNKDEVFDKIDKALGVSKPPDIEVILTDHSEYNKPPLFLQQDRLLCS